MAPPARRQRSSAAVALAGLAAWRCGSIAFTGLSMGRQLRQECTLMRGVCTVPGDLTKDLLIVFEGDICKVKTFLNAKVGKGGSICKTQVYNVNKNANIELALKSGTKLETVDPESVKATFSYADDDNCVFMDSSSFEEVAVPKGTIGEKANWMAPGMAVDLKMYEGKCLDFSLKSDIEIKVVMTDDTGRADGTVMVEIENGLRFQMPSYIRVGDTLLFSKENLGFKKRLD